MAAPLTEDGLHVVRCDDGTINVFVLRAGGGVGVVNVTDREAETLRDKLDRVLTGAVDRA